MPGEAGVQVTKSTLDSRTISARPAASAGTTTAVDGTVTPATVVLSNIL
jgi:hypothetical protein